ncbi:20325_t:CDS:2 [Funneliformis geosporum]|nr:20325_t:CDS:2 [Funneliformis geosporum]
MSELVVQEKICSWGSMSNEESVPVRQDYHIGLLRPGVCHAKSIWLGDKHLALRSDIRGDAIPASNSSSSKRNCLAVAEVLIIWN